MGSLAGGESSRLNGQHTSGRAVSVGCFGSLSGGDGRLHGGDGVRQPGGQGATLT